VISKKSFPQQDLREPSNLLSKAVSMSHGT